MGLLFKAKGKASFGIFLIRLTIGLMFLIAGAKKVVNMEHFINYLKSLSVLPENIAFIFGFILPFAEIFFGTMLIIGFLTPLTGIVLSLITIVILIINPNIPASEIQYYSAPFPYQYIILSCLIMILFSGAGVISFDVFLDKKSKRIIKIESPDEKVPEIKETSFEENKETGEKNL